VQDADTYCYRNCCCAHQIGKLVLSVLIDLIGMSSYALPGVGELGDLGWAPISALLIYKLYGNSFIAGA
jgi:hypothetical protein